MAHYYPITLAEMTAFLAAQGFQPISLPGTAEKVFAKRVHQGNLQLSLRVYTGIVGTESRGVGEDAIRVNLFMRKADGTILKLCGDKRVHRVEGWKANLQSRLDRWLELMPKDSCPKCGMPMLPRKGQYGQFLGCVGYPVCKFTKPLPPKGDNPGGGGGAKSPTTNPQGTPATNERRMPLRNEAVDHATDRILRIEPVNAQEVHTLIRNLGPMQAALLGLDAVDLSKGKGIIEHGKCLWGRDGSRITFKAVQGGGYTASVTRNPDPFLRERAAEAEIQEIEGGQD